MGGPDSEVVDDRDSHVRMGLEAEGEDGGADEEDRDNTNTLENGTIPFGQISLFTFADEEE